ncbi:MAG: hypothetical protein HY465_03345 [Deltaproteobacteria bacterium]|nr:hypothetical protein [Deltaproteobacteria bacterium]
MGNDPQVDIGTLGSQELSTAFSRLLELQDTGAAPSVIEDAAAKLNELAVKEGFQLREVLPHFIKQTAQMVNAQKVYQHFRLPGKDRIVEDRRERPHGDKAPDRAEQKKGEEREARAEKEGLTLKRGTLVSDRPKDYKNYLGDRSSLSASPEQQAATERVERLLSAFERLVIARFEGGREIVQAFVNGEVRFGGKTIDEWRQFFANMGDRSVARKTLLAEIQEFLFRGVIPKGERGVVIADMTHANGRVEKFVRFGVIAEALAKLKSLVPGQTFGKEALAGLTGEELVYLSLATARGTGFTMSDAPTLGKFMGGASEARAAQELGIALEGQLHAKTQLLKRRGKGPGGFRWLDKEIPEETPSQFVPWWKWGNLYRPSKTKWLTIMMYLSLLTISMIAMGTIITRLMFP